MVRELLEAGESDREISVNDDAHERK